MFIELQEWGKQYGIQVKTCCPIENGVQESITALRGWCFLVWLLVASSSAILICSFCRFFLILYTFKAYQYHVGFLSILGEGDLFQVTGKEIIVEQIVNLISEQQNSSDLHHEYWHTTWAWSPPLQSTDLSLRPSLLHFVEFQIWNLSRKHPFVNWKQVTFSRRTKGKNLRERENWIGILIIVEDTEDELTRILDKRGLYRERQRCDWTDYRSKQ